MQLLAYNLHYVNIALGIYFWRVFLYVSGSAALCDASALKCAASVSATKTMTKINAEGTASDGFLLESSSFFLSIENAFS